LGRSVSSPIRRSARSSSGSAAALVPTPARRRPSSPRTAASTTTTGSCDVRLPGATPAREPGPTAAARGRGAGPDSPSQRGPGPPAGAARAHVDNLLLHSFVRAIERLEPGPSRPARHRLRPVRPGDARAERGWLQEHGRLTATRSKSLVTAVNALCAAVRPHARTLVDAFGIRGGHCRPICSRAEARHRPVGRPTPRVRRQAYGRRTFRVLMYRRDTSPRNRAATFGAVLRCWGCGCVGDRRPRVAQ